MADGRVIKARKAVVSNASAWDTMKIIPKEKLPGEWEKSVEKMPRNRSFMHAHIGFDAKGGEGCWG